MNTYQIAALAWDRIRDLTSQGHGKTEDFIAIIEAAIEKATKGIANAHNATLKPRDCEDTKQLLLRVIVDPRDHLGEFERIGDWYYSETGFLRPGKSEPIETVRSSNDPENRKRFSDWWDVKRSEAIDAGMKEGK